jgi:AcrR family transcriptional regulator
MDVTEPPTPVSARTRGRLATRARLVRSARELFAERGLLRVTSHDIARRAGVAAGTFYLHFRDKETLFQEFVYEAIEALQAQLEITMESAVDAPAGIRAQAEALTAFAEANRDIVLIVFGPDSAIAGLESDVLDFMSAHATEVLKHRADAGALRSDVDPAVTAQALVGMSARVVAWWIEDPTRATREAVIDTLTNIQLSGTQPQRAKQ